MKASVMCTPLPVISEPGDGQQVLVRDRGPIGFGRDDRTWWTYKGHEYCV